MNSAATDPVLLRDGLAAWRASLAELERRSSLASLTWHPPNQLTYDGAVVFSGCDQVHVLTVGKAACQLARAASARLGDRLAGGLVVHLASDPTSGLDARWQRVPGAHPAPDDTSLAAGEAVMRWLVQLNPSDHLLVLMSGGGSAMMEVPASGWDLAGLAQQRLSDLNRGYTIDAINQRASARSALKDGRLARLVPCPWRQLTLNDVSDAPDGCVSSGPFLGLSGSDLQIANHLTARQAAMHALAERGYRVASGDTLKGEAQRAGARLPDAGEWDALVLSGETVVTGPYSGRGGRNLELIGGWLLRQHHPAQWALIAGSTDGADGSSGAPGAYFSSRDVIDRASLERALARHDTAPWFAQRGRLLPAHHAASHTGDLVILIRRGRSPETGVSSPG